MKKNIIVIGASGSIGQTASSVLAAAGMNVIRTSSSKRDDFIELDLLKPDTFSSLPAKLPQQIDGIIFCNGYEPSLNTSKMTSSHFDTMLNMHIKGPLFLIREISSLFSPNCCVIMFSSVAANLGSYDPSYAAAKGATNSLVKSLAREFAGKARFNAISPGLVKDSVVYNGMTEDFRQRHIDGTLNKRLLTTEEIGELILSLFKIEHINGQVLHINGGQYFGN